MLGFTKKFTFISAYLMSHACFNKELVFRARYLMSHAWFYETASLPRCLSHVAYLVFRNIHFQRCLSQHAWFHQETRMYRCVIISTCLFFTKKLTFTCAPVLPHARLCQATRIQRCLCPAACLVLPNASHVQALILTCPVFTKKLAPISAYVMSHA